MYCLRVFIVILQDIATMFTVIIAVYSLKSIRIPSYCVSVYIYVPIVMYGLRLFIIFLQELHCLPTFWFVVFMALS